MQVCAPTAHIGKGCVEPVASVRQEGKVLAVQYISGDPLFSDSFASLTLPTKTPRSKTTKSHFFLEDRISISTKLRRERKCLRPSLSCERLLWDMPGSGHVPQSFSPTRDSHHRLDEVYPGLTVQSLSAKPQLKVAGGSLSARETYLLHGRGSTPLKQSTRSAPTLLPSPRDSRQESTTFHVLIGCLRTRSSLKLLGEPRTRV